MRIILDHSNFKDSSCTRQPERLRSLLSAGVQMRTLKLTKGSFACQHSKMVMYDRDTVTIGSMNWTHNGCEKNKEHVMRIVSAPLNLQCARGFEAVWENCEVVSEGRLEESCRLKEEKAAKRAEQAALRRSKSLEVGTKTTRMTTTRASRTGGAVAL